MRRWLMLVLSAIFVASITGCGEEETAKKETTKTEQTEEKSKPAATQPEEEKTESIQEEPAQKEEQTNTVTDEQITPNGGLGDSLQVLEKAYGPSTSNDVFVNFKNDYILVMPMDNKAWNITVQFEATEKAKRTMSEALQIGKGFLPKDIKPIKEYNEPEMGRKIFLFNSALLAKRFPSEAKPGTCMIIAKYGEAGKENEVFSLVIATGDNP
jgi:hypothetical protein